VLGLSLNWRERFEKGELMRLTTRYYAPFADLKILMFRLVRSGYSRWLGISPLSEAGLISVASVILIGFLCLNRRFRAAGYLIASTGSGLLMCRILKEFFVRSRPTVVTALTHFDPESFPSGHSMGSALVYLTLGGVISRQVKGSIAKFYFLSVALAITLLVGISRRYLGVHYPSDVLAGWAAGSLWSSACTEAARWLQHRGIVEPPAAAPV
jgi:undecaprenyl-diphosphatase